MTYKLNNEQLLKQALKYFKLYRRPKEYEKNKSYKYDINKKSVPNIDEEVKIESVEIVKNDSGQNTNVLKIAPKDDFVNLNEYVIKMNRRNILISFEDDVLHSNINQSIWTKESNDNKIPNWDRDSSAEEIKEDENSPNKEGYVIHGAPRYNKEKPITILVDKEVVLKPYYNWVKSPLSDIELYEYYEGSKKAENLEDIGEYKIEYYMEDGIKKTKLLFYPENELDAGKEYKLDIRKGTFVTRGNMPLEAINLRFAIEGDSLEDKGIYKFNITVDGKVKTNEIFDDYLYFDEDKVYEDKGDDEEEDIQEEEKEKKRMHELGFELEGYNFTENIKKVELIKVEDYKIDEEDEGQRRFYREELEKEGLEPNIEEEYPEKPQEYNKLAYPKRIEVSTRNVEFGSVNKIKGLFDEQALKELSKASSLGVYDIVVTFEEPNSISRGMGYARSNNNSKSKGKNVLRDCMEGPRLLDHYPRKDAEIDHRNLAKVTVNFEDLFRNVTPKLGRNNRNSSVNKSAEFKVTEVGKNDNIIKKNKNNKNAVKAIQKSGSGKARFEILLDTSKLEKDKIYEVTIPEDAVRCKFDFDPHHNKKLTWQFTTTKESKAEKIYQGTVPENYDASYPIMIEGKDLTSGLDVRFKNVSTGKIYLTDRNPKYIKADPDKGNQKDKLMVYLPKDKKLPIGLYNILIYSGNGLKNEYSDGVFSVVENGKYVPNEDYREKDTVIDKDVIEDHLKEIIKTSKTELELMSEYTGSVLDLDQIMGEEVLTRDIKYDGGFISTLETKSKWSNVKLQDVRNNSKKPMNIRLGRAEPQVRDNLKKKLRGENIKSEFIIVGGENYSAKKLNLSIPYKQSNGKDLKVLRYDEDTRRINKINIYDRNINKKDGCVEIELVNALPSDKVTKGIFVVIEEK